MTDYNYIENYVADFVDRHISEKVCLNIRPNIVGINPIKKKGSILLAMFWIKVLQSKNNFPPQCISYNKKNMSNSEILFIHVEDVMISLNLLSGALQAEGSTALEWFKSRIIDIIRNYIGLKDTKPLYPDDQAKFNSISKNYNHKLKNHILFNECSRKTSVADDDHLMADFTLHAACESIRKSSLKPSNSWIYRFWKSLLYKWCSDPDTKIIIATSQIDPPRLQDIIDISLLLCATSQIISIYVPFYCDDSGPYENIGEVKTKTLSFYRQNEKNWIEYEIFNRIFHPRSGIGCNFIAAIMTDNTVQIMLTSCRFHAADIDIDCLHSIQYTEMSQFQFEKDFIGTIQS